MNATSLRASIVLLAGRLPTWFALFLLTGSAFVLCGCQPSITVDYSAPEVFVLDSDGKPAQSFSLAVTTTDGSRPGGMLFSLGKSVASSVYGYSDVVDVNTGAALRTLR